MNNQTFHSRLKTYSTFATGLLASHMASADIIHTDVDPDSTVNIGGAGTYDLDINNDGTIDFSLDYDQYYVNISPAAGNSFVASSGAANYPQPLSTGDTIQSSLNNGNVWRNNSGQMAYAMFGTSYSMYTSGNFTGTTDAIVGVRFDAGGNTHYGWVRLDVAADVNSFTVKSYAYNDVPGQSIIGRQTDATTITGTADVGDNGNGSDLQVSFDKIADESLVSEYRVIAVKTSNVPIFDLDVANSLSAAEYTSVTPNGSNHTLTLPAGANDAEGMPIQNGQPYRIFVLSVADGNHTVLNNLSPGSSEVFMETSADPAMNISVADVANNDDGRDLQVSFDQAADESTVSEYRIIVVKSADASSFGPDAAVSVPHYTAVTPYGGAHKISLSAGARDKDGDTVQSGQPYKVFVLSMADGSNATVEALSNASPEITLDPNVAGISSIELRTALDIYAHDRTLYIRNESYLNGTLFMYNLNGQEVVSHAFHKREEQFGLEGLSGGFYIVKVSAKGRAVTQKLYLR